MDKLYGHGTPVSTDEPDQAIRAIPLSTVENCLRYARSCARYDDLRGRPPLLEPRPHELYRRVRTELNSSELAIYGVVRRAVAVGFPGIWVSYAELGELVGRGRQTAVRAIEVLLRVELLDRMPMSMPGGPASRKGHDRSRTRNVYRLGGAARPPTRVDDGGGRKRPARSVSQFSTKLNATAIQLSDPERQKSEDFCLSSGLPSEVPTLADGSSRVEVSPSASDRRLTPSSMPTSSGEAEAPEGRRARSGPPALATLGELAEFRARERQDDRGALAAADAGDGPGWARAQAEAL